MAGGVSPALTQLMESGEGNHRWWYVNDASIKCQYGAGGIPAAKANIPKAIIEGHYRYCNDCIWPVMHDLEEYATYRSEDRALYERFNRIIAREIATESGLSNPLFVQDYQLALLPKELKRLDGPESGVFWHIPWPKAVGKEFLPAIIDLAKSLLSANFVGFHTDEYAENFLAFVADNIPGVRLAARQRVVQREPRLLSNPYSTYQSKDFHFLGIRESGSGLPMTTRVISAPLGLDMEYWNRLATGRPNHQLHPSLAGTEFVLSVDRADYTKGVIPRLESIFQFFTDHSEMIGKVTFAQLCNRSRQGLESFDRYWFDVKRLEREINSKFSSGEWKPILDIPGPLNPSDLSLIYRNASVMLVNPLRDGLNLTAKEFVACQSVSTPGVLALSASAGVFEELGPWSVEVKPFEPREMSNAVYNALMMPASEREFRMTSMKAALANNTISDWCETFGALLQPATAELLDAAEGGAR